MSVGDQRGTVGFGGDAPRVEAVDRQPSAQAAGARRREDAVLDDLVDDHGVGQRDRHASLGRIRGVGIGEIH